MAAQQETVEAYLLAQPPAARRVLRRVRAVLRKALPRAIEGIAYRMPSYSLDGTVVLYFCGFKQHYSLFPASKPLLAALGPELRPHLHNKATLRFAYAEPVPAQLIARIAQLRAAEARAGVAERRARRRAPKQRQ